MLKKKRKKVRSRRIFHGQDLANFHSFTTRAPHHHRTTARSIPLRIAIPHHPLPLPLPSRSRGQPTRRARRHYGGKPGQIHCSEARARAGATVLEIRMVDGVGLPEELRLEGVGLWGAVRRRCRFGRADELFIRVDES